MKYLLDTNVLSELRKDHRAHQAVLAWAGAESLAESAISAISVMEIEIGIRRMARRDSAQAKRLRIWLHQKIRPKFKSRILPVDEAVALRAAELHVPNPAPERDALIAATALVHGLVMVTRNTHDFAQMDSLELFNPWNEA
ncbi:MAG: type II toxin-antitoxin system VapC family toxin [Burkholderiaceae bacterium]|jgi:predicted nucleic acid-binding protein|nr:type II toxin-antitoxin system VapC family toxin [Burkholderiaceae bacterium]